MQMSDFDFEPIEPGHLLGTFVIDGISHYVDAIAVTDTSQHQEAADPCNHELYERLCDALTPNRGFKSVEMNGRRYALFISPYSR